MNESLHLMLIWLYIKSSRARWSIGSSSLFQSESFVPWSTNHKKLKRIFPREPVDAANAASTITLFHSMIGNTLTTSVICKESQRTISYLTFNTGRSYDVAFSEVIRK